MHVFGLCLAFVILVRSENIQEQLSRGLCLCVEENDIFARTDPGNDNPIVGVLKIDNCFVSSGGMLHKKGTTWYQAHTISGTNMWIDGFNLRAENMTVCTNPRTTSAPTTTPTTVPAVTSPIVAAQTTTKRISTTTFYDPFAGGLNFCLTDDGQLVDSGNTYVQNGVTCTCTNGFLQC